MICMLCSSRKVIYDLRMICKLICDLKSDFSGGVHNLKARRSPRLEPMFRADARDFQNYFHKGLLVA